jgi:alpha-1,2-mannosyltransferase
MRARWPGLLARTKRVLSIIAFALLPIVLLCAFTLGVVGNHFAFDFHTFWIAARDVLHGRSPYPAPETIDRTHLHTGAFEFFVYPPPFVVALAPLAVLPFGVAAGLFVVLLVASILAVPALLGVRDWRCYGVALAAIPMLSAFRLGAVTPLLALALALAWRYRERWPVAGAAVGCAIVIKLFIWPVALWLVVTRRWKAAAVAIVGGAAATMIAWAALGFAGFAEYPTLLRALSRLEATRSYSLVAVADRLGLPHPQVAWLALAGPLVIVVAVVFVTALREARGLDRRAFVGSIALALILTPILWLHYFGLLLVPVALVEPVLGVGWLALLLFWVSPWIRPAVHPLWRLVFVLALAGFLIARAQRQRPTA